MQIQAGAESWSHVGGPASALLVHGFNGSPGELRPWGEHLAGHGIAVRIPRLPGHGTSWRAANLTRWPDWYAVVDRTLSQLRRDHPVVVVAGLGVGATLALRLATRRSADVAGLVLVNPSLGSDHTCPRGASRLSRAVPAWPAPAADVRHPQAQPLAVPTRVPLKACASLPDLWDQVRPDVPAVAAPTLLVTSALDRVVDPADGDWVASTIGSTELTQVLLPSSGHLAPLDSDRDRLFDASTQFIHRLSGRD